MSMDYANRASIAKAGIQCAGIEVYNLGTVKVFKDNVEASAIIHSELSGVVLSLIAGNPKSQNIPEFSSVEEAYADVIIMILNWCVHAGYPIGDAVVAKTQLLSGGKLK